MNFFDFNREDWVKYLAKIKVNENGILTEKEQEAYDKFLMKEASGDKEKNRYHKELQKDVDNEILKIAQTEKNVEDLEMYKIYAGELKNNKDEIEEDEVANSEFEW